MNRDASEVPARAVHCAVVNGSGGVDRLDGWISPRSRPSRSPTRTARRTGSATSGSDKPVVRRVPPALRLPQLPRPRRAAARPLRRPPAPGHRSRRDRHRRPALRRRVRPRREDPLPRAGRRRREGRAGRFGQRRVVVPPPAPVHLGGVGPGVEARRPHPQGGQARDAARRDVRARPGRPGALQPRRRRQHRPRAGSRDPRRAPASEHHAGEGGHLRLLRHARRDARLGPVVAGAGRRGRLRAARRRARPLVERRPRRHRARRAFAVARPLRRVAAGAQSAGCSTTAGSRPRRKTS